MFKSKFNKLFKLIMEDAESTNIDQLLEIQTAPNEPDQYYFYVEKLVDMLYNTKLSYKQVQNLANDVSELLKTKTDKEFQKFITQSIINDVYDELQKVSQER